MIEKLITLSFAIFNSIFSTNPRTSNPTVGSHRILSENCRILSDPTGIHRKLLDSLGQDSDGKLWDVGKCRNILESDRNPDIPALSDIRQLPIGILSQGFCRNSLDPIGSFRVYSSWAGFVLSNAFRLSDVVGFH